MSLRIMRYAGMPSSKYVEARVAYFSGGDLEDFMEPFPEDLARAVFRVEARGSGELLIAVDEATPAAIRELASSTQVRRAARRFLAEQEARPYGLSANPDCWPNFGACFVLEAEAPLPDWTRTIERAPGFIMP